MTGDEGQTIFVVPGPNDPRLDWDLGNEGIVDRWEHLLDRSGSRSAVMSLVVAEPLADADVIALGRLNFHSYIDGFSPPVAL